MTVLIAPAFIDPLELPCVALERRDSLPSGRGIYFAISKNRILYIGMAKNFHLRWRNHHRYQQLLEIGNVFIHWLEIKGGESLGETEESFKKFFNPTLNDTVNSKAPKDRRLRIPDLSEHCDDLLLIESALHSQSRASRIVEILDEYFAQKEEEIRRQVEYLAWKRGLTFEAMWLQMIKGDYCKLTAKEVAELEYRKELSQHD